MFLKRYPIPRCGGLPCSCSGTLIDFNDGTTGDFDTEVSGDGVFAASGGTLRYHGDGDPDGVHLWLVEPSPAATLVMRASATVLGTGDDAGGVIYRGPDGSEVRWGVEGGNYVLTYPGGSQTPGAATGGRSFTLCMTDNGDATTHIVATGGGHTLDVPAAAFELQQFPEDTHDLIGKLGLYAPGASNCPVVIPCLTDECPDGWPSVIPYTTGTPATDTAISGGDDNYDGPGEFVFRGSAASPFGLPDWIYYDSVKRAKYTLDYSDEPDIPAYRLFMKVNTLAGSCESTMMSIWRTNSGSEDFYGWNPTTPVSCSTGVWDSPGADEFPDTFTIAPGPPTGDCLAFDNVRLGVCGEVPCVTEQSCATELTLPAAYTLTVPAVGEGTDPQEPCCEVRGGDFILAVNNRTQAFSTLDGATLVPGVGTCGFRSIDLRFQPGPPNDLWYTLGTYESGSTDDCAEAASLDPALWSADWEVDAGAGLARMVVKTVSVIAGDTFQAIDATYYSAWMPVGDLSATAVTVDLDNPAAAALLCDFPSPLTLNPASAGQQRAIAGCDRCETFDHETGLLVLDGTIGGSHPLRVCLAATFNEEAFQWEYDGTEVYAADSPFCPNTTLTFQIRCEGDPKKWVLKVSDGTTTVTLPITFTTYDPLDATVSGTLTGICGDAVLVANLSAWAAPTDGPNFGGDCGCGMTGEACWVIDSASVSGGHYLYTGDDCYSCEPGGVGTLSNLSLSTAALAACSVGGGSSLSIPAGEPYLIGPVPFCDSGLANEMSGKRLVVRCNGSITFHVIDENNCLHSVQPDWTSASVGGQPTLHLTCTATGFTARMKWDVATEFCTPSDPDFMRYMEVAVSYVACDCENSP